MIHNKLKNMVGKKFLYKSNQILIKDWYPNPDDESKGIIVITDGEKLVVPIKEIEEFIKLCLPIADVATLDVVRKQQKDIEDLKSILFDNISKVQTDKEYVKQAQTINNSINTLLNMVNLQIKVEKLKQ